MILQLCCILGKHLQKNSRNTFWFASIEKYFYLWQRTYLSRAARWVCKQRRTIVLIFISSSFPHKLLYFDPILLRGSTAVSCVKVFSSQTKCYWLFWVLIKVTGTLERIKGKPMTASTTKWTFGKEVSSGGKKIGMYECTHAYVYVHGWGRECVCIHTHTHV